MKDFQEEGSTNCQVLQKKSRSITLLIYELEISEISNSVTNLLRMNFALWSSGAFSKIYCKIDNNMKTRKILYWSSARDTKWIPKLKIKVLKYVYSSWRRNSNQMKEINRIRVLFPIFILLQSRYKPQWLRASVRRGILSGGYKMLKL